MLTKYIDIYCERLQPGLWAEPLNALTNAAFIIAAMAAWMLLHRQPSLRAQAKQSIDCRVANAPRNDLGAYILITLVFAMGIGSTLFHTFAQLWAMLSDTLPILFYQIAFIVLYSRYVMKWRCRNSALLLGGFILTMAAFMQMPRDWLNGSLEYAPAFIFLFGLGLWHYKNITREKFTLLAASALFLVSLTFRSIDMALCESFPIGTHFLWHSLNGLLLYLTTRAYIKSAVRQ